MATLGYVQPIRIPDDASSETILAMVNDAFKPVYRTNTLPYFPEWYLLRVVTQYHSNGEVKKGVPCWLVPTVGTDYLTLTR